MKCVSPFYVTARGQWVPCGKCNFCLQRKRSAWSFRLHQELKVSATAHFITLTYAPEALVFDVHSQEPALEKTHLQSFMKRLRYHDNKQWPTSLRYYAVGEYGGLFDRPHYHVILFNLHPDLKESVQQIWGHGHVHIGKVEPASVAYVTGYVITRTDEDPKVKQFPFALMSKARGGLGAKYLTPQMMKWHKQGKRNYAQVNGHKVPLARLYSDRLFSSHAKAVMAVKLEGELDAVYATEIERLGALHSDPISYYQLKVDQAYNRVKINK